jgi:hypothetical protein
MTANVYRVESSTPLPTPNLEDQVISLSLASPLKPVRHGWPAGIALDRVHWCTQAPLTQQQSVFDEVEIQSRGRFRLRPVVSKFFLSRACISKNNYNAPPV